MRSLLYCISRPAASSYVSLAFGRYVVEPFFAPCAAPTVLIKLVSILGVSEWFYVFVFCSQYQYVALHVHAVQDASLFLTGCFSSYL